MATTLRPPAVPLVTIDPYFNVWSTADRLYEEDTKHWTNARNSMVGMVRIDGVPYQFMGAARGRQVMEQQGLSVAPLSSVYTFEAAGIRLIVDFTSPLLLDDLQLMSRPLSYITFEVQSIDNHKHDVSIYLDLTGEWCVNTIDQAVEWQRGSTPNGQTWLKMGTASQQVLNHVGDDIRIDWGYAYLIPPDGASSVIHAVEARDLFWTTGALPVKDDEDQPRPVRRALPLMACVTQLTVDEQGVQSAVAAVAYDDIEAVEYFQKPLQAYWRKDGTTIDEMIDAGIQQYEQIKTKCTAFNKQLIADATAAGGAKYADMTALAYRQSIAAHKLAADEDGSVLFFSKECFSNGCMATVDVSYPSTPLYLLYNPELVKGMLRPVFRFDAMEVWPFDFAPHDVGTYPKANGQVYAYERGDDMVNYQMPVEESGNMLLMTAAVCLAEGNADFAASYWDQLTKWARYLLDNGLNPGNQLCTDDFAGHLAQNTNLSIKAILGIAGYAEMCGKRGLLDEQAEWLAAAKKMAAEWERMAADGDRYKLTFDGQGTWSQKYNLIWDLIFGWKLFSEQVVAKEVANYLAMQNRYGLPLDSRKSYTKADWLVWSAALTDNQQTFEALIAPLWQMLHETDSRVPFTDLYDTTDGLQTWFGPHMGFQNRTVVGGIFMKLLRDRFAD